MRCTTTHMYGCSCKGNISVWHHTEERVGSSWPVTIETLRRIASSESMLRSVYLMDTSGVLERLEL